MIKHSFVAILKVAENLWMSLHVGTERVYMESPKVAPVFLQKRRGLLHEILVTENEDTLLCSPERKLVILLT